MPNLEARLGCCWWDDFPVPFSGAKARGSRILTLGHMVRLQNEERTPTIPASAYYPDLGLSNGKDCPPQGFFT